MAKTSFLKKIVSFVLAVSFVLSLALTLTSCNRKYDEEEVIEATEELLKKATILNTIYYGHGIEYYSMGHSDGRYYQADPAQLMKYKIETIADLKTMTSEVFTVSYCNLLYRTILQPLRDGDTIKRMARYYQHYEDAEQLNPDFIMVYADFKPMYEDKMTYNYSTIKVLGSKKDVVNVTVEAEVRNDKDKTQIVVIDISLKEERLGWRIDNPVYANYNEYLDKYEG